MKTKTITKRTLFSIIAVALASITMSLGQPGYSRAEETPKRLTVVELYTSQGCSSCPPADAMLHEMTKDETLLPLAFHVDYWDYIGWADTNAIPESAARQRTYAKRLGLRSIYTPQMVVQGVFEMVGGHQSKVKSTIEKVRRYPYIPIEITQEKNKSLVIDIPGEVTSPRARVYLVAFDKGEAISIKRGENRGKTIFYANTVRAIAEVGRWTSKAQRLHIPTSPYPEADFHAVLLQSSETGHILGAGRLGH